VPALALIAKVSREYLGNITLLKRSPLAKMYSRKKFNPWGGMASKLFGPMDTIWESTAFSI